MINFLEISVETIALIVPFSVFFISGFALFYYPIRNYNKKKKRCSVVVEAKVIGHDVRYYRHNHLFANKYKFNYNGQEYEITDSTYNNFIRAQIGSRVQLMINPQNLQEIILYDKYYLIPTTIMGGILMGIPLFVGFLYLLDFLF